MGGMFAAPKAPPPPPPPEPEIDPEEEERKKRIEAIERRRRGRAGLVHTSSRGLLGASSNEAKGKNLLGE